MEGNFIGQQPSWNEHLRSGVWTLKDQFNRRKNNLWSPAQDPHADKVVFYLKGDGNYIDSSANPKAVSANNTIFNTSIKKYGTASINFAGSSASYLSINSHSDFTFEGDFTIENWYYVTNNQYQNQPFFDNRISSSLINKLLIYVNGFSILMGCNTGSRSFGYSAGQWMHLAVSRTSGNISLFNNGSRVSTPLANTEVISGGFLIGKEYNLPNYSFIGCIDSFRITKGVGRYTSNFNPELDTYLAY